MSGLIHIYCGDGKGKTTAAVGLSVRAAGNGWNILFVQFMKIQKSGEINLLKSLPGVTVLRTRRGGGFSICMDEKRKRETIEGHNELLKEVIGIVQKGETDLLVLDEIMSAYNTGLIDKKMFEDFVVHKPDYLELVMTGRNPPQNLLDIADYVSEIKKIKHPYDRGIQGRKGIEQ
ncbi:cob(I)yrinic acid a,c-diamide adenosyltransferase [Christensenella tenuis]|jgi:cob(I)alamin adenosyltransferase|uniref:Cob(I)yrinic acid a,c-diamide adenosyltransferase n=1 Tax=Christensenella tenuis TaxID=2763033 RepID=A0ABR7EG73_9FIRM|nr:cob(I)yrinic acid a,c-diamide adenosyltransferase [Christensenella tenuis]MBC5648139.1 cob(I)yrinic acid a,c-diamide adenosyltransferase [Christensenella tenuis]